MSPRRRTANLWLALTLAGMGAFAAVLRAFPPQNLSSPASRRMPAAFYPSCPFHDFTGLLCPGCGGTRALAALARGDVHQAMQSNGLVVVALTLVAAWLALAYLRALCSRQPVWPHIPAPAVMAATISALIFTVVRNLT